MRPANERSACASLPLPRHPPSARPVRVHRPVVPRGVNPRPACRALWHRMPRGAHRARALKTRRPRTHHRPARPRKLLRLGPRVFDALRQDICGGWRVTAHSCCPLSYGACPSPSSRSTSCLARRAAPPLTSLLTAPSLSPRLTVPRHLAHPFSPRRLSHPFSPRRAVPFSPCRAVPFSPSRAAPRARSAWGGRHHRRAIRRGARLPTAPACPARRRGALRGAPPHTHTHSLCISSQSCIPLRPPPPCADGVLCPPPPCADGVLCPPPPGADGVLRRGR